MWFRSSDNGSGNTGNGITDDNSVTTNEQLSKFQKFRRSSCRRLSSIQIQHVDSPSVSVDSLSELKIPCLAVALQKTDEPNGKFFKSALSESRLKLTAPKKPTLKTIKTEPTKRKLYKSINTQSATIRQNSHETTNFGSAEPKLNRIVDIDVSGDNESSDNESSSTNSTDDEDIDVTNIAAFKEKPVSSKEKILLIDPKYKHNRIEKSSSKKKMNDFERRESIKHSRSSRKISTPNKLVDGKKSTQKDKEKQQKKNGCEQVTSEAKTHQRVHSNLQALVKFVMKNKKLLSTEDFVLINRGKSISETTSAVITSAALCSKPIALKFTTSIATQDGGGGDIIAQVPNNDTKTNKNDLLVKKQNSINSFYETNKHNNKIDVQSEKTSTSSDNSNSKMQRNGSNSSNNSRNFEDEAFYWLDEQVVDKQKCGIGIIDSAGVIVAALGVKYKDSTDNKQLKISSPSLTSRVAAKINETTNIYKNRKAAHKSAKKRKTTPHNGAVVGKRVEFYKQISVERLNSSAIIRQPSDRRPDANVSQRSTNGNASNSTHNNNDLQSLYHGTNAGGSSSSGVIGYPGSGNQDAATNATAAGAVCSGVLTPTCGNVAIGIGGDINAQDAVELKDGQRERYQHHPQYKSAPVSVNRSESYKERLSSKRNRNSRRKTSDPSLTSRPNDDQPDLGLSNSNYSASSNSSLSSGGGSESPSTSMEQVGGAAQAAAIASGSNIGHHQQHQHLTHHHQHSHQDSFHCSIGSASTNNTSFWGSSVGSTGASMGTPLMRQWNFESDEEEDLNEADWSSMVAAEMLAALTDAEKKRQEIINEIYQTERSHVRTLKLLDRLFFVPLFDSGLLSQDHLMLLFPPALLSLRELHGVFESKLKQRRVEHNHVVNHVGDLLASMFDGQSGEQLREFAAQFCASQQIALEALKEKRRKDEQLQKLLTKSESHKACRRLQLKDLLPTVLQRLTKYPLLFENLYKVTIRVLPQNTTEAEAIQRALESSKKILVDVNQAVKTAEDAHKLQNIQRKLDKSTFDKDEFKNLDLTQYRLIHDGSLTMKKNPSVQLHGLLFENMIVLLTKQDDKYSLKYLHAPRSTEVNNKPVNPIMSIDSETLVRQEAADKNSFFLIKTKTSQMLELRAPSSSECKTWFKHISDAAEQYKPRSKNANSQEPVDDPAIATLPHSNTKESLELTPERPPPMSAIATVTTTPLAPLLSTATVISAAYNSNNNDGGVQLRNGTRESTSTSSDQSGYYNLGKQRLSHNELIPSSAASSSFSAVNRTMSTRSCGEATHGDGLANGITLRHTQSARQANGSNGVTNAAASAEDAGHSPGLNICMIGGPSKRDSASIVYSNNANNTRTLLMQSPLVDPTAIQISVNPAHTAEPVLTPAERLRRLDAFIRDGLFEKQKIICDMFRLPVEHFNEIVDIAMMPEAPKDSADIALAAYDQVQSLTKVLNEYMQVTSDLEISAVSTTVCDQCHENQHLHRKPATSTNTAELADDNISVSRADSPPPLPPPNKQQAQAQQQTLAKVVSKLHVPLELEETSTNIHEDDDGYCEIDELRLPALSMQHPLIISPVTAVPVATFRVPPSPTAPTTTSTAAITATNVTTSTALELVKRQSTISADSIPEESADEVSKALVDYHDAEKSRQSSNDADANSTDISNIDVENTDKLKKLLGESGTAAFEKVPTHDVPVIEEDTAVAESQKLQEKSPKVVEHIEINDVYDTLAAQAAQATLSMIDNSTQTAQMLSTTINGTHPTSHNKTTPHLLSYSTQCGTNRLQHANSLEPSVPCHALNNIVSALNEQISLLLPKINERDMERERLRKENQHLRELLSAMHERQRVEEKLETPINNTTTADDALVDDDTPTSTPLPTSTSPSVYSTSVPTTPIATERTNAIVTEH